MDKPLVKTTKKKYQGKYLFVALSTCLFIGVFVFTQSNATLTTSGKNYNVATDNLVISTFDIKPPILVLANPNPFLFFPKS